MQKIHAVTVSVIVPQLIDNAFDNATKIRPTFLKFATFQSEMQFSNFILILPTKYYAMKHKQYIVSLKLLSTFVRLMIFKFSQIQYNLEP